MMRKNVAPLALVVALVLTLLSPTAAAAGGFPDVTGVWSWCKTYVDHMAAVGVFQGYEDGTFRTANQLTAGEALAICARGTLSSDLRADIAADHTGDVKAIVGSRHPWFWGDFAVCLELGVVSEEELTALYTTGGLDKPVTKADFSLWLVRAMGLTRQAAELVDYTLPFSDQADIAERYRPYIYLLNRYGMVEGTDRNEFQPNSSLNRAVSATMLSRVAVFLDEQGLDRELPDYTGYDWISGTVTAVSTDNQAVLLTLRSGEESFQVALTVGVVLYQDHLPVDLSALAEGAFVRVCLDEGHRPFAVRITPARRVVTYTGPLKQLEGGELTVTASGQDRVLTMDRFTQFTLGGRTGDSSLLDLTAGYTKAAVVADRAGAALSVTLSGGASRRTGILRAVTTDAGGKVTGVTIADFKGAVAEHSIPADLKVDGVARTLTAADQGVYVVYYVANDAPYALRSLAANTAARYVQGTIQGATAGTPSRLFLSRTDGQSASYSVTEVPAVTFEGALSSFTAVTRGWFVTLRLNSAGAVERIDGFSGLATYDGALTELAQGDPAALTLAQEDGTARTFHLPAASLPEVERDGLDAAVTDLRPGDKLSLTTDRQAVTHISALSAQGEMTAAVNRIITAENAIYLELISPDDTLRTYPLAENAVLTREGAGVDLELIRPGYVLSFTLSGGEVVSGDLLSDGVAASRVVGSVLIADSSARILRIVVTPADGVDKVVTLRCDGAKLTDGGGESVLFSAFAPGDPVTAYGDYTDDGFTARLVLWGEAA